MLKYVLCAVFGATLALAAIISCGNNAMSQADAAVPDAHASCSCPPAEPPLAGRIKYVTNTVSIPANMPAVQNANCPIGAMVLGGSCGLDQNNTAITLSQSATGKINHSVWACAWNNPTNTADTGIVTAICLIPASAASDAGP